MFRTAGHAGDDYPAGMGAGTRVRAGLETAATMACGVLGGLPFAARLVLSTFTARATRERHLALIRSSAGGDVLPDEPSPPGPGDASRAAPLRVLIVAGEPSGDLHAADLARALRSLRADVELIGLGGPRMAEAGVELAEDLVSEPVMGLLPVLRRLPWFAGVYRRLLIDLDERRPDVVVGVDYPGLNARVARAARRRGIPFVQYVAPQVWGWAPWRARSWARDSARILTFFPFELPILRAAGADAAYVGHPLVAHLERRPADEPFRSGLRRADGPLVALLPGSRRKEVARNLPVMLRATRMVSAHTPAVRYVVALASERLREDVERLVREGAAGPTTIAPPERSDDAMAAADAALTVSGTATLHLVAHGTPPVVVYHATPAGRLLSSVLVVSPFIALPNLVAGEELVPEFLADENDDERIANALLGLMPGGPSREHVLARLAGVRGRLRADGVPERAAAHVLDVAATHGM